MRHEAPCRLAGRGAYAIVNSVAPTPSKRETHLGYHLSHPPPEEMGEVQKDLGISAASSFIVQIKNPLAPATGPQAPRGKGADYPEWLMHGVFGSAGAGETEPARGREEYGLRFASCETIGLMDYTHAQLLMIAARPGEEGLEETLGEGRGEGQLTTQSLADILIDILFLVQRSRNWRRKKVKKAFSVFSMSWTNKQRNALQRPLRGGGFSTSTVS